MAQLRSPERLARTVVDAVKVSCMRSQDSHVEAISGAKQTVVMVTCAACGKRGTRYWLGWQADVPAPAFYCASCTPFEPDAAA